MEWILSSQVNYAPKYVFLTNIVHKLYNLFQQEMFQNIWSEKDFPFILGDKFGALQQPLAPYDDIHPLIHTVDTNIEMNPTVLYNLDEVYRSNVQETPGIVFDKPQTFSMFVDYEKRKYKKEYFSKSQEVRILFN